MLIFYIDFIYIDNYMDLTLNVIIKVDKQKVIFYILHYICTRYNKQIIIYFVINIFIFTEHLQFYVFI